ncbi:MAG: DUF5908 family protein [Saonia sp.]
MAVQINEVIIRAVVNPTPSTGTASEPDCPPQGSSSESELVEKVLEILREKKER